ncbi:MAG: hypothetical protein KF729_32175 [Sandaracinaceae bacterium]|nr:hypothetical protein [Sandaracinaceae bacterium]
MRACAELLARTLRADGGLTIELYLLPEPEAPGMEAWERELADAYRRKRAKLPKVAWSPKTRRLTLKLPSELPASALVGPEATAATLDRIVADLARTIERAGLEGHSGAPVDEVLRAVRQLQLDRLPGDPGRLVELAIAGGRESRPRARPKAPPAPRPIIDIRYHIRDEGLRRAFAWAEWVGDRICRKLREHGLSLGGRADHLNIVLSAAAPHGVASVTRAPAKDRFTSVDVGIDPDAVGGTREAREDLLADLTCAAIEALRPDAAPLIRQVRAELAVARRDLAVVYFRKETAAYAVRVLHQMHAPREGPLGPVRPARCYYATLEYEDRRTGVTGRAKLFDFDDYEEIHGAIGMVSVVGDVIRVRPKRGDDFDVPLDVPLSALVRG